MNTFKQFFIDEAGFGENRPPNRLANMIQNTVRNADATARAGIKGGVREQELQSAMAQLSKAHKLLDQYSSEDLKRKIVDKYNKVKHALEQQPTAQNVMDCVQHFRDIYNIIVG